MPEFAYSNIPVVVACKDYTSAFNIALRAKNKNHLRKLIENADNIKFKINKNHIYEFIYMHFVYFMGYKKKNEIFKKNVKNKINTFHNKNYKNITNHRFFQSIDDHDYKDAEYKIENLLKEIKI